MTTEARHHRYALKRTGRVFAAAAAFYLLLLAGCEYSGHSIKAQTGRRVGDTVKGTEYSVGCEVQFRRVP